MTVYYRSRDARITDVWFESRCPTDQAFRIRELSDVHVARPRRLAGPARSTWLTLGVVGVAGLAVMLASEGAGVIAITPSWFPWIGAFAVGTVVATVVGLLGPPRPTQELRARYQGTEVCLFRTADALVFGQVSRALLRVLELTPAPDHDPA